MSGSLLLSVKSSLPRGTTWAESCTGIGSWRGCLKNRRNQSAGLNTVRLSSFALNRELVERSTGEWASTVRQAHDSVRTANLTALRQVLQSIIKIKIRPSTDKPSKPGLCASAHGFWWQRLLAGLGPNLCYANELGAVAQTDLGYR